MRSRKNKLVCNTIISFKPVEIFKEPLERHRRDNFWLCCNRFIWEFGRQ